MPERRRKKKKKKKTSPTCGMPDLPPGFIFRRMPKMFDIKFSKRRFRPAEADIKKKKVGREKEKKGD